MPYPCIPVTFLYGLEPRYFYAEEEETGMYDADYITWSLVCRCTRQQLLTEAETLESFLPKAILTLKSLVPAGTVHSPLAGSMSLKLAEPE